MASLGNLDELNNIKSEVSNSIVKFFSEMELPEEEKDKRIALALTFYDLFDRLFLLALAMAKVGKLDRDWLLTFMITGYVETLEHFGIDTSDNNIVNRVKNISSGVVDTTLANIGTIYYFSSERAVECAETETNAVSNYQREQDAIKAGYTRKRWNTMLDNRVRKTHIKADGQEVPIRQPFIVGGYQLMFPLDQSLGAHAKECIGCRCSVEYLDKKSESINENTNSDTVAPIKATSENDISFSSSNKFPWVKKKALDTLKYAKESNSSEEVARVYDKDFKELDPILGTKNSIDMNVGYAGKVKYLVHNHPNNSNFSNQDIMYFSDKANLEYMIVVGNNGKCRMISKENFDKKILQIEYTRLIKKYKVDIAKDEQKGYDKVVSKLLSTTKSGLKFWE